MRVGKRGQHVLVAGLITLLLAGAWSATSAAMSWSSGKDRVTQQALDLVGERGLLVLPNPDGSIESFRWSPDGGQIAAAGYDGKSRWRVFLADRGEFRPITSSRLEARSFGWMPDSKSLLVAFDDRRTSSLEAEVHSELAVVSLEGDVVRSIPLDREMRAWYGIAVSPDGARAVVSGGPPGPAGYDFVPQLIEIDLAAGTTTDIAAGRGTSGSDPRFIAHESIVFVESCEEPTCESADRSATVLDLETGAATLVTPEDFEVLNLTTLDGESELLFVGFRDSQQDGRKTWSMPMVGGRPASIRGSSDVQALDAQPNGDLVLYRSYDLVTRHGRPDRIIRFHLVEYPGFEAV